MRFGICGCPINFRTQLLALLAGPEFDWRCLDMVFSETRRSAPYHQAIFFITHSRHLEINAYRMENEGQQVIRSWTDQFVARDLTSIAQWLQQHANTYAEQQLQPV